MKERKILSREGTHNLQREKNKYRLSMRKRNEKLRNELQRKKDKIKK